jgi:hypothetical protein
VPHPARSLQTSVGKPWTERAIDECHVLGTSGGSVDRGIVWFNGSVFDHDWQLD